MLLFGNGLAPVDAIEPSKQTSNILFFFFTTVRVRSLLTEGSKTFGLVWQLFLCDPF